MKYSSQHILIAVIFAHPRPLSCICGKTESNGSEKLFLSLVLPPHTASQQRNKSSQILIKKNAKVLSRFYGKLQSYHDVFSPHFRLFFTNPALQAWAD
jgi:hypothetical protein